MFSQLFGNYLVKENVITQNELDGILNEQSHIKVKLGTMAIAEKLITEEQAARINEIQQQVDKKFGDIAVENNYLTKEDVELLLEKQGSSYMRFLQLLLERTNVAVSKVDAYIEAFREEYGFDDKEMNGLKQDNIEDVIPFFATASKPYVTDIVGLVLRNITRFVTDDFYIGHIKPVTQFEYRSLAGQCCVGDYSVYMALASIDDDSAFINVAESFTGQKLTHGTIEVYDAVGEFVNCNSGLLATALARDNVHIEIMPQFAYSNQIAQGSAYVLPIYIGDSKLALYIAVDSDVSIGTMPLVRKMRVQQGSDIKNSKGRIVIVDDSGMSRRMLRNVLEEAGYSVVAEAADGIEGVMAYKQYAPDIITLDITMPNMNGTEALKEIKAYDEDAKVIMITAAGQQNKIIEALKIGAEKFITKPFDRDEVLKNIEELL